MQCDVIVCDVDGTLTEPKKTVSPEMARLIEAVAERFPVYAASGGSWSKIRNQLPESTRSRLAGVFTCGGNEFHRQERLIYSRRHQFPEALFRFAERLADHSVYPHRAPELVESRVGMFNLSILGPQADEAHRLGYALYDDAHQERLGFVSAINSAFPEYDARLGSRVSIDVSPRGANKVQILGELKEIHGSKVRIRFFGDRISCHGNDFPLARALEEAKGVDHGISPVRCARDTFGILHRDCLPTFSSKRVVHSSRRRASRRAKPNPPKKRIRPAS